MTRIKTDDLAGQALDCAVGMCKPLPLFVAHGLSIGDEVAPTTNSAQCEAIIVQYKLVVTLDGAYRASKQSDDGTLTSTQMGQSEAEAAMRCFVHSHFGDEIEIPDFLLRTNPFDVEEVQPKKASHPPEQRRLGVSAKAPMPELSALPKQPSSIHPYRDDHQKDALVLFLAEFVRLNVIALGLLSLSIGLSALSGWIHPLLMHYILGRELPFPSLWVGMLLIAFAFWKILKRCEFLIENYPKKSPEKL